MDNARLRLQTLARQRDQVLVVAHVTALRLGQLYFTRSQILSTYAELRLPQPANPGAVLSGLRQDGLVLRSGAKHWAVTPIGDARVAELGITIGAADFRTEYASELGESVHHTIGAEFAPLPLSGPIGTFLNDHPFDRNVFGISRYPDESSPTDVLRSALETARATLQEYSLDLHLASDRSVSDELWPNVAASMWACRYGVAFVESRVEADVNRNVLIEVGAMLMTGRRCVLLKDTSVHSMPTDLVGHIYKPIDLDDATTVESALREWCEADLQLI